MENKRRWKRENERRKGKVDCGFIKRENLYLRAEQSDAWSDKWAYEGADELVVNEFMSTE